MDGLDDLQVIEELAEKDTNKYIRIKAKKMVPEVIDKLHTLMISGDKSKDQLDAANRILDLAEVITVKDKVNLQTGMSMGLSLSAEVFKGALSGLADIAGISQDVNDIIQDVKIAPKQAVKADKSNLTAEYKKPISLSDLTIEDALIGPELDKHNKGLKNNILLED